MGVSASPLSSSLLWEILTPHQHTHNRTLAAFALCCRRSLYLLDRELRDRRYYQQLYARYFVNFYKSPPAPQEILCLLRHPVSSGNLKFVQWIAEKWAPNPEEVYWDSHQLLCCAAFSGSLPLVQWMMRKWPSTIKEVYDLDYYVLRSAARSGSLPLVQWLVEEWPPRLSDFATPPWNSRPLAEVSSNPEVRRYLRQIQQGLQLQQQAAAAQPTPVT